MDTKQDFPDQEVISQLKRTARIEKPCSACSKSIEKGQVYYRAVLKIDGDLRVFNMHSPTGQCANYD